MECPVCGRRDLEPLGRSRYRCVAPARLVSVTPPPAVGSTWGPLPIADPVREPCGAVFTDTRELEERNRACVLIL